MTASTPTPNPVLLSHLVTSQRLDGVTTFIAEKTTFRGDLLADDGADIGIKIDGVVDGSIIIPTGGVIHIGPTGVVKGNSIEADYLFIEGRVEGKVVSRKGVEFTGSSHVSGEVEYQGSLNTHNLAKMRCAVRYTGPEDN